jgi:preprotein translocase subunit SecA
LRQQVTEQLSRVRPLTQEEQTAMMAQLLAQQQPATPVAKAEAPVEAMVNAAPAPAETKTAARAGFVETDPATWGNPGRNDDCPCGSGNKFKHCHGKLT